MKKIIMLALGLLSISAAHAGFWGDGPKTEIQKAHEVLKSGDLAEFSSQFKKAWMEEGADPDAQKNLLSLMQSAKEKSKRGLPADWKLPTGVNSLCVSVRRILEEDENLVRYRLQMNGTLEQGLEVKQLKLAHYGADVILDKEGNTGTWYSGLWQGKNLWFSFQAGYTVHTPELGLYVMTLELSNGAKVDGWFVLTQDLLATDSPEVTVPAVGQVFSTINPTFSWKDFTSSQYQPSERRKVVVKIDSTTTDVEHFDYEPDSNVPTEVTIVKGPEVDDYVDLVPGSYQAQVIYRETHYFGDLKVRRESATRVPFKVK